MAEAWRDYFETGEKLLWEGKPKKGGRMGIGMIGLAVFGTPFLLAGLGISVSGLLGILGFIPSSEGFFSQFFLLAFGAPFLAVGAGLVFGPRYVLKHGHKKVRYALSDRRAYIASTWWGRNMEILPITEESFIEIENGESVIFHIEIGPRDSDGDRSETKKGFKNIDDAMHVYKLIRKIQAGDYERFR